MRNHGSAATRPLPPKLNPSSFARYTGSHDWRMKKPQLMHTWHHASAPSCGYIHPGSESQPGPAPPAPFASCEDSFPFLADFGSAVSPIADHAMPTAPNARNTACHPIV